MVLFSLKWKFTGGNISYLQLVGLRCLPWGIWSCRCVAPRCPGPSPCGLGWSPVAWPSGNPVIKQDTWGNGFVVSDTVLTLNLTLILALALHLTLTLTLSLTLLGSGDLLSHGRQEPCQASIKDGWWFCGFWLGSFPKSDPNPSISHPSNSHSNTKPSGSGYAATRKPCHQTRHTG